MGKILVVAEKPSVAKDIAKVLKCTTTGKGYIYGEDYVISWAIGHLVTLCEPEDYSPSLKKWTHDSLPIIPDQIKLKANEKTKDQLEVLKKLMNSNSIDSIICATDSGREGELIFRYIYSLSGCKKSFQRLWISSMTDSAIKEGFRNLKSSTEFDLLYMSAKARSEADWLVGINATRAYTISYNALLTIGRVQTPTLAVLVERQKEINAFVPEEYFEVEADFGTYKGMWFLPETNETKIKEKEFASQIAKKVKGQNGIVKQIEHQEKKNPAPLLYDLTELQRDCNRKFGLSAQRTLDIAQELYEKRKMITYPRTDSRYLSDDYIPKIHSTIDKLEPTEYGEYAKYVKALEKLPISKRIIDNSKITDHHAIVPTDITITRTINSLTIDEKKVYDLIARRFLAVFYPYYIFSVTKLTSEVQQENFISKGNTIIQLGWMELYKNDVNEKEEPPLPLVKEGEPITALETKVLKKKTSAPKLYNEATLLSAMENAGRQIEDEALKEQMKDSGLGTPATRAGIIERLISVGYIERKGKTIVPTEKGMTLIEIVPNELKTPETTGKWEKGLSSISKGTMDSEKFMGSIKRYVLFLVGQSKNKKENIQIVDTKSYSKKESKPLGQCPLCQKGGVYENTKAYFCDQWKAGCKFTIWKSSTERYGYNLDTIKIAKLLKNKKLDGVAITMPQTNEKGFAELRLKESGEVEFANFKRDNI